MNPASVASRFRRAPVEASAAGVVDTVLLTSGQVRGAGGDAAVRVSVRVQHPVRHRRPPQLVMPDAGRRSSRPCAGPGTVKPAASTLGRPGVPVKPRAAVVVNTRRLTAGEIRGSIDHTSVDVSVGVFDPPVRDWTTVYTAPTTV